MASAYRTLRTPTKIDFLFGKINATELSPQIPSLVQIILNTHTLTILYPRAKSYFTDVTGYEIHIIQ
jgi:hypothetical protein